MKHVKRFVSMIFLILIVACSNEKEDQKDQPVNVDKNSNEVEITLPAVLFNDQNIDEVIENVKKKGISEVIKHDDGSLTYVMSKSVYNDIKEKMEKDIQNVMSRTKKKAETIHEITSNKNYSEFTAIVDQKTYENSIENLITISLGITGLYYQAFIGNDAHVTISLKDKKTGEVFSVLEFPDVLEEKRKNEK